MILKRRYSKLRVWPACSNVPLKARLAKNEERAGLKSLLIIKQLQKEFVWSLLSTPNAEQDRSFLQLLKTIMGVLCTAQA